MLPNTSRLTGDSSCQPTMAGAIPEAANTPPRTTPVTKTIWWGLSRDMGRKCKARPAGVPGSAAPEGVVPGRSVGERFADVVGELVEELPAPVDGRPEPEETVDHALLPAEVD